VVNLLIKGCGFDSWGSHLGAVVVSLNKKLYSLCSSLPSCTIRDLEAWCWLEKAAHPVETSMETWCNLENKCSTALVLPYGVMVVGALTFHCETCLHNPPVGY